MPLFRNVFFGLALISNTFSLAASIKGVEFPDRVELDAKTLVLNGMGTRKATIFKVEVYVAGLYLEAKSSDASAIQKSAGLKKVHLHFLRNIEAKKIQNTWEDTFKDQCQDKCEAWRPKMDALKTALSDMKVGSTQSYVFSSNGVKVFVNEQFKTEIEGTDFSSFLLGAWVADYAPNSELREGLLGQK